MRIYAARHVLPVAKPPISDGAVAVLDDKIVALGPREEIVEQSPGIEIDDLGDAVIMPGLVNAHTHLELSWMEGALSPTGDYDAWLRELLGLRAREEPAQARLAAEQALLSVIERGTVAVGDVTNGNWVTELLANSSIHALCFHEIYGFRNDDAERLLVEAAGTLDELEQFGTGDDRLRVVPTPHAAHTTSASLLRALAGRATAANAPLSIHTAESEGECRLIANGEGPMRDLLEQRGAWQADWQAPGLTPVGYLHRLGLLSPRTLAVHCVHLTREDHSLLQSSGATVVTCPRSNRSLGVGLAPVPELLREGVPVALGTDSLASSPDLDCFAELAALLHEHAGLAPAAALRMATLNGARALGLADRLGSIEPGRLASLVTFALDSPSDDPLECLRDNPSTVRVISGDGPGGREA